MKNLILILSFLLIGNIVFSQSEKILTKTFTCETDKVLIDINGIKKINYWESNMIKINLTINVNTIPDNLNSLVKINRYALVSSLENSVLVIKFLKELQKITINNQKLIENFEMEIWLPKGTVNLTHS